MSGRPPHHGTVTRRRPHRPPGRRGHHPCGVSRPPISSPEGDVPSLPQAKADGMTTTQSLRAPLSAAESSAQYSLAKILGIWAAVTAPMAVLAFVVAPAIMARTSLHPGIVYWAALVVGMMWQFVVSLLVLRAELGGLHWESIKERIWLNLPRDPRTARPRKRLFIWVAPAIGANVLGEELLFRGVLLPRMAGVFGRWDWVANTVLFGLYHVHKIWFWPSMITSSFGTVWAAKRYRSLWMGVIVHGVEGWFIVLVLGVILGSYS